MREPRLWIVGRRGLLGSQLQDALSQLFPYARFWEPASPHFSWIDPEALAREIDDAVAAFTAQIRQQQAPWAVLWCAGIGTMKSSVEDLQPEWLAWRRMLESLRHHLGGAAPASPGAIFLASSAGALYETSASSPITKRTPIRPDSAYGAHKLRMEAALRDWAGSVPNVSVLIGRISSLYGPRQNTRKAQGLISRLSQCLIYRRPVNIYVPLDTRRDYLFTVDCADRIAASVNRLMIERPREVVKIFASEEPTSLARILGVLFRLAKHRSMIVLHQPRGTQMNSLKFRSEVWREPAIEPRTDLATGIHLVHEHQLQLFCKGQLPPPQP
jgi:UDP-glucose 4-epimerase